MKQIVFGIILVIFLTACLNSANNNHSTGYSDGDYSHIFVPDSIRERYDMNQRFKVDRAWMESGDPIYHHFFEDSTLYEVFLPPNMDIREVFSAKNSSFGNKIDNMYDPDSESDRRKFAVYTVNCWRNPRQLVLLNNEEITVIYMGEYTMAIRKLLEYFEIHAEVDKRLLPLCIQELTRIYVNNERTYTESGPWRHWWDEEADSLGRIYNQYLRY